MKKLWIIGLAALILVGCKQESKRQYWDADMESQHIEIVRVDNAILNVKEASAKEDIQALYDSFPEFMPYWVDDVMRVPDEFIRDSLAAFIRQTQELNEYEQNMFADISWLQQSLDQSFTRIHYLWPDMETPSLYLYPSFLVPLYFYDIGYSKTIYYFGDNWFGIDADMYLGADFPYYQQALYEYKMPNVNPARIPVDFVHTYLSQSIAYVSLKKQWLDRAVYEGKIMYLTAQIFDDRTGYEVMGWTQEQWNWAVQNEAAVWDFIMTEKHLYTDETRIINEYMNDAPFTSAVGQDSPGRLGIWIGWRIVEQYMEKNPEVSLQQLMAEPDAQKILTNSKYKP